MARNEIFLSRTVIAPDTWRYYWRAAGAHVDDLINPTVHYLPQDFILEDGFKRSFKLGEGGLPIGIGAYDSVGMKVDLATIADLPLYGYMTDTGQAIAYQLVANSVWTLFTDGGNETLDESEFLPIYQGVQVYYVGGDFDIGDDEFILSMQLVHIGKVIFETITSQLWADEIRSHIGALGGTDTERTHHIRERLNELVYRDAEGRVYAVVEARFSDDGDILAEECIHVSYEDIWTALEELADWVYRQILRDDSAEFRLRSTRPLDGATLGTPYDYYILYRQSLDTDGDTGTAIARSQWCWPCWSKDSGSTTPTGGLFHSDGIPQAFPTVLEALQKMTEEGVCRAAFIPTLEGGNEIMTLQWYALWDDLGAQGSGGMPPTTAYERPIALKRGDLVVQASKATLAFRRGDDIEPDPVEVPGAPAKTASCDVQCIMTLMPGIDTEANQYFIRVPATGVGVDEIHDGDFDGNNFTKKFIVGRTGFTFSRFTYMQPHAAAGGPAWITSSQSIAMRVHHWFRVDLGGVSGTYNVTSGYAVELPTLETTGYTNQSATYYSAFLVLIREALKEQQRRSGPSIISTMLAKLFSNISQSTMKLRVARPNAWTRGNPLRRFPLHPSDFRAGIMAQLDAECVITEFVADIGSDTDEVTVFFKAGTM